MSRPALNRSVIRRPRFRPLAGMTLLELLIVLAILATLTAVAVSSVDGLLQQSRYDASERLLNEVESAVLGPAERYQPDGTPLVSGFVADLGRWPVPRGAASATQLAELWEQGDLPAFGFQAGPDAPVNDADIRLPGGWRGPYLRLGLGRSELRDGWGGPLTLATDADNQVRTVTSLGANGAEDLAPPAEPYARDLSVALASAMVAGAVFDADMNQPATAGTVRLYRPNPAGGTLLFDEVALGPANTFLFTDVPPGPRALRIRLANGRLATRYLQVPRPGLSGLTIVVGPPGGGT